MGPRRVWAVSKALEGEETSKGPLFPQETLRGDTSGPRRHFWPQETPRSRTPCCQKKSTRPGSSSAPAAPSTPGPIRRRLGRLRMSKRQKMADNNKSSSSSAASSTLSASQAPSAQLSAEDIWLATIQASFKNVDDDIKMVDENIKKVENKIDELQGKPWDMWKEEHG